MKALDRLDIYIIGDRQHVEGVVQKKANLRLKEKEQILRITKPSKRIVYGVKSYRKTIEPEPNAPLLKRIIKNPKPLDVGYMIRKKRMRAKPEKRLIYQVDTTLRDYLHADKRVKKMRPMDLYYKAEIPKRISIEEWLKNQNESVESLVRNHYR
jgi:hypothetical protein